MSGISVAVLRTKFVCFHHIVVLAVAKEFIRNKVNMDHYERTSLFCLDFDQHNKLSH